MDASQHDRQHLLEKVARFQQLELIRARMGMHTEPHTVIELEQLRCEIDSLKTRIGIQIDCSNDAQPSCVLWADRDSELLKRYFERCVKFDDIFQGHANGDEDAILRYALNHGLAVELGGECFLTQSGTLLCSRRDTLPQPPFHVHIKVQTNLGTSFENEEVDEIWGSVLYLYFQLLNKLSPLYSRRMGRPDHRDNMGSESTVSEYPEGAILEALANFLIHRDYGVEDFGRIRVFSDRIEFTNPGQSRFSPEQLLTSSVPLEPNYVRNACLVAAMNKARFNQREGQGILRIRRELERNGSFLRDGSIGLTLKNDEERNRFTLTIFKKIPDNPLITEIAVCSDPYIEERTEKLRAEKLEVSLRKYLTSLTQQIDFATGMVAHLTLEETPKAVHPKGSLAWSFTASPIGWRKLQTRELLPFDSAPENLRVEFNRSGNRILILGEPGSGKTNLLMQFARHAAKLCLDGSSEPIPMLLSLSHWDPNVKLRDWVLQALEAAFGDVNYERKMFMFLFDGLDEIQESWPKTQSNESSIGLNKRRFLHELAQEFAYENVILTCRTSDYQEIGEKASLNRCFSINELTNTEIKGFLAGIQHNFLWPTIHRDDDLLKLSRNPLLLNLHCRSLGRNRPSNADFSTDDACSRYILSRFDHESSRRPLPFSEEITLAYLSEVAARTAMSEFSDAMNVSDFRPMLGEQSYQFVAFARSMHLLQQTKDERIEFVHSVFRDFFAVRGLAEFLVKGDDVELRRNAAKHLLRLASEDFSPLRSGPTNSRVSRLVENQLKTSRIISAVPELTKALRDEDAEVRLLAVSAFWYVQDARAIPELIRALSDEDDRIRAKAAESLGKTGSSEAIASLVSALMDSNSAIRWSAARALGEIGGPAIRQELMSALDDTKELGSQERQDILRALEAILVPPKGNP